MDDGGDGEQITAESVARHGKMTPQLKQTKGKERTRKTRWK